MSHKRAKRVRRVLAIRLRTVGALQGLTRPERRRELAEAIQVLQRVRK